MRVAIDIAAIARGGMERQVIELAGGLERRGHDVLVVAQKGIRDYHEELDSEGVAHVALQHEHPLDVRLLPHLVRTLRAFSPDVVICENFNATLWGRIAGRIAGARLVVAEHTTGRDLASKVIWTNRLLAPYTSAVVACSHDQVGFLVQEGHPKELIRVIHNGVDATDFRPDPNGGRTIRAAEKIDQGQLVVGLMAAHRPEKRHDRFVTLIELLADAGLPVCGLVVGGGPLLESNRRLVSQSPHAERFRVLGARSDVVALYSAMDVLAFVSDLETFPMAALEAQACGVPVFALKAGGLGEAFQTGTTGELVGPGEVERLAAAIARAAREPGRFAQMGSAARVWVEESLSVDKMVEEFEELLLQVVSRP